MDVDKLKQLFPTLEDSLLEEIGKQGTIKQVKAGEALLKVGQTIRSTMLVIDGLIKLYREDDEGKEFFIYHLDAGQACSLSMVCAAKHETSEVLAKALTDATVLAIPLEFMDQWMSKYKSWYQFVITSYLLKDESGKDVALFSGDTLFIGDVGRPDLAQKKAASQKKI